jgi:hypothetical protein
MQSKKLVIFSLAELVGGACFALMFVYVYPWLYNTINKYTKRGPDLHEKIDFVNSMLMFIVSSVVLIILTGIIKK